ncbi:hypothetical protein SAMN04883147_1039149 [Streptomyces sp. DpondAA-F4]|nr:hypothetical protein SAMN04883147_1039149 [Streptomyces sp. DpondAA-F4]
MGGVAEQLRRGTRQAEGEDGSGCGVDRGPYDGVDPPGRHRLDHRAQFGGRAEQVRQLAVGTAQRALAREVEPDTAEVGAVTQMGGVVLSATG